MRILLLFAAFALTTTADAQWQIQNSGTTASLRGIDSVGKGVAWASGTEGTVLRTEDGGATWQRCSVPPGAEALDFRGVQAFDAETAIVMSSGKGDLSRLYKTTDGCRRWKLLFANPDKEGFWDAIKFVNRRLGVILGDPILFPPPTTYKSKTLVTGFVILMTEDEGKTFEHWQFEGDLADPKTQGAFAASNSSLFVGWPFIYFGSGGLAGPRAYLNAFQQHIGYPDRHIAIHSGDWHSNSWATPLASGASSGIFSIGFIRDQYVDKDVVDTSALPTLKGVCVGGNYMKPAEAANTAAFTDDGGQTWTRSITTPRGYRSAVAYDSSTKTWITVGPNGTDVSTDDGRNWRALKPGPGDAADADLHWNALSLPFVVGPKGRIGVLRADVLSKAASK